ncbi:diguanylate cyclase [Sulfuricurvum kujiense DSM 16994]|uniref:diguanylate cyclase n=1 Tax=Sulfuricurvum kujiense (strain ATCC BAA-921 / DSM 16994 / JCM 11577 / YK-1) TaxID=709032 RepID=E4TY31_SULKY|nr:diguanylate cyclase [Sulfuricurvum kujiense]ADR33951.1 diguanylate cyclase [Sulfuricurvum kujiense DSM 16994]
MQIPKKLLVNEKAFALLLIIFGFFGLGFMTMQYKNQMLEYKKAVLENAHVHILGLMNLKTWNDFYDGVYVKKRPNIVENSYIDNDVIVTDTNESLIRINHAWMLRQLSERIHSKMYNFTISSLHPKNPVNKAKRFEARALHYLEQNPKLNYYYEFNDQERKLYFLEPLKATDKCIQCHYYEKPGENRGGITIVHDTGFLYTQRQMLLIQSLIVGVIFVGMLAFIYRMYRLLLRHNRKLKHLNETLEEKVDERTRELDEQNNYLQAVLDSSPDIIIITDGEHLLSANGSFFSFFRYETLEAFKQEHECICDFFDKVDELEYLHDKKIDGQLWPFYLLDHSDIRHKVQMTIDSQTLFFSIKARRLEGSENKVLVELSDITEVETQKKSFEKLAITDKLTGLINRFQFDILCAHTLNSAKRDREPLSLIMFDIDFFKNVNDNFGHNIGDITLRHTAKTIAKRLRSSDIFARWGGEEFMILLPKSGYDDAMKLAEDLRSCIENEVFEAVGHITISFGVAVMEPNDDEASFQQRADKALYMAKNQGRNCVAFCR